MNSCFGMAEPLDLEPSLPCTAVAYKKGFHNKKVLVQIPRDWKVFFFPLSHHVTIVILLELQGASPGLSSKDALYGNSRGMRSASIIRSRTYFEF